MPNQETLIACRVCDQVFFDNKSLFDHYMRLHVGSFESSVNSRNFFSGASHITCSSVPLADINSSASCYFGPNSSQRVTPSSDISVDGNYVVPTPLRNFLRLRGPPASTPRSSSNFHSAISTSILSSHPKQSSNSSFRFASQPTGQPSFRSLRSHITLGISNSQLRTSTSKPTRQLILHSPIDAGAVTSGSMSGGTCSLSNMPKRYLVKPTRQSEVQNIIPGYTKPYIMQLEHPIEEMTVVDPNDNGGDSFNLDEIDLTLKL